MKVLGQGSGGTVFSINKFNTIEEFAIKIMSTPYEDEHKANIKEIELTRDAQAHPNIIKLVDYEIQKGVDQDRNFKSVNKYLKI